MKIDIHTHVLPEMDDGARDWNMCLQMLRKSVECGVECVIATPHYLPWRKNAHPERIRQICQEAKEKITKEQGIAIDIYPGNEIYYSVGVTQRLKEGEALTLADSRYVLVEFKTASSYHELCRAVREFRDAGYIPIIAHVERYQCLEQRGRAEELKEMGALFQMNIDSVQGGLFQSISKRSKRYLSCEMIDFLASDMHDMDRRPPMAEEQLRWVQKKLDTQYRNKLLYENAKCILNEIKAEKGYKL